MKSAHRKSSAHDREKGGSQTDCARSSRGDIAGDFPCGINTPRRDCRGHKPCTASRRAGSNRAGKAVARRSRDDRAFANAAAIVADCCRANRRSDSSAENDVAGGGEEVPRRAKSVPSAEISPPDENVDVVERTYRYFTRRISHHKMDGCSRHRIALREAIVGGRVSVSGAQVCGASPRDARSRRPADREDGRGSEVVL